jgi:hypothetical protein
MFYPKNDRLFYLCPGCAAGGVTWCGKNDLQGRKLFVCEKDELHITTLERLRGSFRKAPTSRLRSAAFCGQKRGRPARSEAA